ncbi:putative disease resistance RPP13-like protein 1 [Salvia hispanica]|uniref:putative disease resistance RPP13-like protein 1 n=1 Tax=Salvia hispanica TaxID=49212 RepID=UPI002009A7A2|nr:putative disease resistance RPP13-like protein 1 [Salvia hispanica]
MASDGVESKDDILKKLKDALKDKTFLLVLDDVWNENSKEWDDFMNSMSGITSTMGNGIIISTRSQKVASTVKPFHIHSLKGLSDDDCWSIIKAKAFDGNGEVPPEFVTIGKEIAKRCQGLPLAANVVGGVLRRKSEGEWRVINDEGLPGGEGAENIQKILKLSFDYLPSPSLKKCFAYCSIYPKGHDKYGYNNVSYVMHDLVHDLASAVLSNGIPIRYMFLKEESSPIPKEVAKHLRTLIFEGDPSHTNDKLPAKIGRLTSLQTLPEFSVGKEKGYRIEELGSLKNLRESIEIQHLERVCDKKEAMKANMLEKPNLYELVLQWDEVDFSERNDESVLEGLRPHANLKKLRIEGYKGKRFPTWLQGEPQGSCLPLHNLIEIKLYKCSECEEITLDHLPNLRSLYIRGLESLKCLSKRFFYNHRNLSFLNIEECDMLEALPDGLDTLNSLERLTIERCRNLKSMGNPSCGEGENQGTLRLLSIKDCGELMELPRQMLELWAPTIELLELEGLRSLTNLPMLIDCLAKSSHLRDLTIRGVPKLMSAGSVESWDLGSLRYLNIDVSEEWSKETSVAINETVNGILEGCCNSLEELTLRGVENWEWLPQSIQRLTSLSILMLENIGIEELPQWFGNLSALRHYIYMAAQS